MGRSIRHKLEDLFSIDRRSLSLFRVTLSLIILGDLFLRLQDLTAFYTDSGVVPRAALLRQMNVSEAFSLHLMSGSAPFAGVLFGLHALCAFGLLIGWRTTWMTVACWLFASSLDRRNPMILSGGDDYLRLLLFWSMFIPLKAPETGPQKRVFSWGTAAILLQTTVAYWMTALLKWNGNGWREGTALYYVLHLDLVSKPLGHWLLSFPSLLKGLTHTVLAFEFIGPALLLSPMLTGPIRTLTVFAFIAMQLAFHLGLHVGIFPLVSAAAMLPFLPSWFWDRFSGQSLPEKQVKAERGGKVNVLVPIFFACVLIWNLESLLPGKRILPKAVRSICFFTHVDQGWRMFTAPLRVSGWFVVPGTLANGKEVDLLQDGKPLNWEKPWPEPRFKNERWRRFFTQASLGWWNPFLLEYGAYQCRSWNEIHSEPEQLQSLQVVYMNRTIPPPPQEAGEYSPRIVVTYDCSRKTGTLQPL